MLRLALCQYCLVTSVECSCLSRINFMFTSNGEKGRAAHRPVLNCKQWQSISMLPFSERVISFYLHTSSVCFLFVNSYIIFIAWR
ncbi:hypothetical protein BX600DRAFT_62563 [Xylariales sp. PMI_506]|nr:hypothetical protein BX600DRAFT_62563 [Xylariales sp. PMI_506]